MIDADETQRKEYQDEVGEKLREDFENLIDDRFSNKGYFVTFKHEKSCTVIVYGNAVIGLDIHIRSHRFPNFENRKNLKTSNLLEEANFEISQPIETIGLNKKVNYQQSKLVKLDKLMNDLISEEGAKFYNSRLGAANDQGQVSEAGYGDGTLVIDGLSKFDFFLREFSAVVEGDLSQSVQNKTKIDEHEKLTFMIKRIVLITLVIIVLAAIFLA